MSQEKIIAFIPSQYVADWKNDENITLKIFQVLNIAEWELKKIFCPKDKYIELGLHEIVKKGDAMTQYELTFEEDGNDRKNLVSIKKTK